MQIDNLDHPGVLPVDGDLIKITYPNGSTEQKQFWSPPAPAAPTTIRDLTPVQFLKRFTQPERIAIRTAALTDPYVNDFVQLLNAITTDPVHLDDPDTVAGLAYLESIGKIAAGRVAAIRA